PSSTATQPSLLERVVASPNISLSPLTRILPLLSNGDLKSLFQCSRRLYTEEFHRAECHNAISLQTLFTAVNLPVVRHLWVNCNENDANHLTAISGSA